MRRRVYKVDLKINGYRIDHVVIDPHYELKHGSTITDQLILELVMLLDDGDFAPETKDEAFEYYKTDNMILKDKKYRLIWLIEKNELFVGIINAYRRK